MKLIFCRSCEDLVSLREAPRSCSCGKSKGNYRADGRRAVYSGPCVPVIIKNESLDKGVAKWKDVKESVPVEAFVIPLYNTSMKKEDEA